MDFPFPRCPLLHFSSVTPTLRHSLTPVLTTPAPFSSSKIVQKKFKKTVDTPLLLWNSDGTHGNTNYITYENKSTIMRCGDTRSRRCHLHGAKRLFTERRRLH